MGLGRRNVKGLVVSQAVNTVGIMRLHLLLLGECGGQHRAYRGVQLQGPTLINLSFDFTLDKIVGCANSRGGFTVIICRQSLFTTFLMVYIYKVCPM